MNSLCNSIETCSGCRPAQHVAAALLHSWKHGFTLAFHRMVGHIEVYLDREATDRHSTTEHKGRIQVAVIKLRIEYLRTQRWSLRSLTDTIGKSLVVVAHALRTLCQDLTLFDKEVTDIL